ncbi:Arm DNA-binding domain-containing protein [Okeania sp. SIO1I7]|uniref:Arm DNA-binding domain-containing protein n=1 Tax=Okeania sp. SIO1I7 TaxID=2607772 RepID=UPI0013FBCCEE|nr:DUF3596 domain-containing protein [Okeania sp. SIO1I7]NET29863.1 DUF3596 domain-containing protein [Okeania sp. SIO1I7]
MEKANNIIESGGRGKAKIHSKKGRLEIRFSKQIFGKDKVMALRLADSPDNYPQAKSVLALINADISAGKFDFSLERYRPTLQAPVEAIVKSPLIIFVWEEFLKANRYRWKDSTWNYLKNTIKRWIPEQFCVNDAEVYRNWLLENTTVSMSKRVLTWVRAAVTWWSDLHSTSNFFSNIIKGLKHRWEESPSPRPFTDIEVECIFDNFNKSQYYSFYTGFVRFLLATGCRPSEAVGLRWSKVSHKSITFRADL